MNHSKLAAMWEKRKAEEIMMSGEDYSKAMEHLHRARQHFPAAIEELEPLKTACDILTAAKGESPGCGVDHYWVLGVDPSCSFVDTRSRYRKLVNLLQPIRTHGFAGRAMALLDNALSVLTDVKLRTEFDQRRKKGLNDYELGSSDDIAVPMPSLSPKATWSAKDLAAGQIWAVFGERRSSASMPRHYVRFDEMVSESQAAVTFLEPAEVLDHEVKASKEGLPISCGIFRISERRCNIDLWRFLFRVRYQQNMSCYKIYPREGEIWAVYRGWNVRWGPSDYERSECVIGRVEMSPQEGNNGITLSKLVEVEGCLTLFRKQKQDGFHMLHVVPKANVLCFSHRIPAFRVPGIERYGIPAHSWHLEPNALPL